MTLAFQTHRTIAVLLNTLPGNIKPGLVAGRKSPTIHRCRQRRRKIFQRRVSFSQPSHRVILEPATVAIELLILLGQ